MRITGGSARGRNLISPKSGCRFIRPTSDRVREALFNILSADIPDSIVLDLYAGTGALGMEALSRGAKAAVFIDRSRQSLRLIQNNLRSCFALAEASLLQLDLSRSDGNRLRKKLPPDFFFDLIFLDPPYEKKLASTTLKMVEEGSLLQKSGLVIAEEQRNAQLPEQVGTLRLIDRRIYGETGIWIYRVHQQNKQGD